jgi:hypothetical protein
LLNGFEQIKVNTSNTYDHRRLDTRGNPKITSSTAFLTNTDSFRVSAGNVDLLHRFFSKKLETNKTKDRSINASYGNLLLSLKSMMEAIKIVDSINGMSGFDSVGLHNRKAAIYQKLNQAADYFYEALGGIEQANRRYGSQILEPQKSIFTNVDLTPAHFMRLKKHCDELSRYSQGIFRYRAQ